MSTICYFLSIGCLSLSLGFLLDHVFKEEFDLSGAFIDLATYDEEDKYMYS